MSRVLGIPTDPACTCNECVQLCVQYLHRVPVTNRAPSGLQTQLQGSLQRHSTAQHSTA